MEVHSIPRFHTRNNHVLGVIPNIARPEFVTPGTPFGEGARGRGRILLESWDPIWGRGRGENPTRVSWDPIWGRGTRVSWDPIWGRGRILLEYPPLYENQALLSCILYMYTSPNSFSPPIAHTYTYIHIHTHTHTHAYTSYPNSPPPPPPKKLFSIHTLGTSGSS